MAFSALFVSFCSLGIAVHHGHTMQRLVEANSRPFIQFSFTNGEHGVGDAVNQVMILTMSNPGAGAARVEKFSVLIDGKQAAGIPEALMSLGGVTVPDALGPMTYATVAPSYLKAGSDDLVWRWPRTDLNAAVWDRVLAVAGTGRVKFQACYCSIFDECWVEHSVTFRPTPVERCT